MQVALRHLVHSALNAVVALPFIILWRSRRSRLHRDSTGRPDVEIDPHSYVHLLDLIKSAAGPSDVLTRWRDVKEAPAPSIQALATGEAASFVDNRGTIYRFKLGESVYVNMYYTKAGYRRSGDLHDCTQYDVVLRGRTRLRLIDPVTGVEHVREYKANDFIVIPARTPHMFEFLEDNYLLEWWESDFKAWYYAPYRSVIESNAPLEGTEGVNFSIDIAAAHKAA